MFHQKNLARKGLSHWYVMNIVENVSYRQQISSNQGKVFKKKKKTPPYLYTSTYLLQELRGSFRNAHELLNLRALKISTLYKNRIFQYMGEIFCVEFHTLKFCKKYLTRTLKDV